jgi:hypothetical protein
MVSKRFWQPVFSVLLSTRIIQWQYWQARHPECVPEGLVHIVDHLQSSAFFWWSSYLTPLLIWLFQLIQVNTVKTISGAHGLTLTYRVLSHISVLKCPLHSEYNSAVFLLNHMMSERLITFMFLKTKLLSTWTVRAKLWIMVRVRIDLDPLFP